LNGVRKIDFGSNYALSILPGRYGLAAAPTLSRRSRQFDAYCHLARGVLLRQE